MHLLVLCHVNLIFFNKVRIIVNFILDLFLKGDDLRLHLDQNSVFFFFLLKLGKQELVFYLILASEHGEFKDLLSKHKNLVLQVLFFLLEIFKIVVVEI